MRELTERELFTEGLATLQDYAQAQALTAEALKGLLHYDPARMSVETLTATEPIRSVPELGQVQSVGVLNWSTVAIQVGFAGRSAIEGNGVVIPPRSWLVMPLEVNLIDLGADQVDLVAGPATVGLVRFDAPQPLMAGSLGGVLLPVGDTRTYAGNTSSAGGTPAGTVWVTTPVLDGIYEAQVTVSQIGAALDTTVTNPTLLNGTDVIGQLISYQRSAEGPWPMTTLPRVTLRRRALALSLARATIANSGWSGSIAVTRIA